MRKGGGGREGREGTGKGEERGRGGQKRVPIQVFFWGGLPTTLSHIQPY